MTETVTIPKSDFEQMKKELKMLRGTDMYKRLLEFEKNIEKGEKFTRDDLEF